MHVTRADLLRPLLAAAALATTQPLLRPLPAAAATQPRVTERCFLDLRIINRYDVEVLEDAATRGRLELGLYGDDAPKGVARFLEFIDGTTGQFAKGGGGPAYSGATIEKLKPGTLIEGGRIAGLKQVDFAGNLEWEYMSRLLPSLRPVLEVNELTHSRRGLLTIERFNSGPEFGLTLGAAPALDGSHEVIGEVVSGGELLGMLEELPYITGKSLDPPGSPQDEIFKAQKALFGGLSKAAGDKRAEDRTGRLLRRVEITKCGRA